MKISNYLTIAGTARRCLMEAESSIASAPTAFPKGPDDLQLLQEVAMCESILANARALLGAQMLELDFTAGGRAQAKAPKALKGSEYDQGFHREQ